MICQICGKHNASILVQQIVNGMAKELYLCKSCAKKHNLYADEQKMHLSLKNIFEGLLPKTLQQESASEIPHSDVCPECGTRIGVVQEKKMIGCPYCFFYFRDTVVKLMQEVGEDIFYGGAMPAQCETYPAKQLSLQQLELELQRAVNNEEYELAAYFRDKINSLGTEHRDMLLS